MRVHYRRSVLIFALVAAAATLPDTARAAGLAVVADGVQYDMNATSLAQHCANTLHDTEQKLQLLLKRSPRSASFTSVVLPLENFTADTSDALLADQLLGSVSSDRATRDASDTCQAEFEHMLSRTTSRPELAALLQAVERGRSAQSPADRKLLELWIASVERSGAGLAPREHQTYLSLTHRLEELQSAFMANLSNTNPTVTVTKSQIAGLPDDFVQNATENPNRTYTFVVDESTDQRFLRNARDESARRAFYDVYTNRGYPENEPILRETLSIRLRLANLLGYPDWASYVLADRMARTPDRVHAFLDSLDRELLPVARREAMRLTRLKAADTGTPRAMLNNWDTAYYDEQLRRGRYAVDTNVVRRYFPARHVIRNVFDIYSRMLGVSFAEVVPAHAWSADVQQFAVSDATDHRFLGTLYLDLYPRPGKYTHFASFPLLPRRTLPDGRSRPPIDAIIGNWSKPAPGAPATLSHEEVQTFFHEFGHAMAALLTTAPYETLSQGFRTDFVEAPSQMLENFVWTPALMKKLSSEVDTGAPLPDDLIDKIVAARHVDDALFNTQQIFYAEADLAFHSSHPAADPHRAWRQIALRTTPLVPPETAHSEASFAHIMAGYDAGYYGYLWSRVYAQDMFTLFERDMAQSSLVGARYRRTILEPARIQEPDEEVRSFLGRAASPQAFYQDLGIRSAETKLP